MNPYPPPSPYGVPPVPPSGYPAGYGQPGYPDGYRQPGYPDGYGQPGYGQPGYGQPPYPPYAGKPPRPGTVTAAAVMTIVVGGLFVLLAVVFGVVGEAGTNSDFELNRDFGGVFLLLAAGIGAYGLGVGVCGILTLKRSRVAAVITMVLSGLSVLGSLGGLNSENPGPAVVSLTWAAVTLLLLLLGPSRRWLFRQ